MNSLRILNVLHGFDKLRGRRESHLDSFIQAEDMWKKGKSAVKSHESTRQSQCCSVEALMVVMIV